MIEYQIEVNQILVKPAITDGLKPYPSCVYPEPEQCVYIFGPQGPDYKKVWKIWCCNNYGVCVCHVLRNGENHNQRNGRSRAVMSFAGACSNKETFVKHRTAPRYNPPLGQRRQQSDLRNHSSAIREESN
jgi:hypothetical protein